VPDLGPIENAGKRHHRPSSARTIHVRFLRCPLIASRSRRTYRPRLRRLDRRMLWDAVRWISLSGGTWAIPNARKVGTRTPGIVSQTIPGVPHFSAHEGPCSKSSKSSKRVPSNRNSMVGKGFRSKRANRAPSAKTLERVRGVPLLTMHGEG
jgi:hypothetical protein